MEQDVSQGLLGFGSRVRFRRMSCTRIRKLRPGPTRGPGAFDIIPDTVYHWRIRQDGSSITQNKHSIRDLEDRLCVVDSVSQLLVAEGGPDALLAWFTRVLGSDLVPYFEQVPYAGDDYWDTLHAGLAKILSSVRSLEQRTFGGRAEEHRAARANPVQPGSARSPR